MIVPCVAVDPKATDSVSAPATTTGRLAETGRQVDPWRIGVAYEVQVVERIDAASWDIPLDVIVTESRVIRLDAT